MVTTAGFVELEYVWNEDFDDIGLAVAEIFLARSSIFCVNSFRMAIKNRDNVWVAWVKEWKNAESEGSGMTSSRPSTDDLAQQSDVIHEKHDSERTVLLR